MHASCMLTLALRRRRGLPVPQEKGSPDELEAVHLGEVLSIVFRTGRWSQAS